MLKHTCFFLPMQLHVNEKLTPTTSTVSFTAVTEVPNSVEPDFVSRLRPGTVVVHLCWKFMEIRNSLDSLTVPTPAELPLPTNLFTSARRDVRIGLWFTCQVLQSEWDKQIQQRHSINYSLPRNKSAERGHKPKS